MPGYRLHCSPRLETFLEKEVSRFLPQDPLDQDILVVLQNAALGEWLKTRLVRQKGVVFGMDTALPEMALRRLAAGYSAGEESRPVLFLDGLKAAGLKAIEEALQTGEEAYRPLAEYAGDPPREDRLVSLADGAAGLFSHYGMNCLPLVEAWERGEDYPGCRQEDRPAEAWQRLLWRRIFHPQAPYTHLSRQLSSIMASGASYTGEVRRVILLGSACLGETGLGFLHYLARDVDVDHFLLSPSRAYGAGGTEGEKGEENLEFLRSSGGLIRGFSTVAAEGSLADYQEDWRFPQGEGSLLGRLRQILINDASEKDPLPPAAEESLSFHNAASRRREVEGVKEQILRALREDPSLSPSDIGVLAPDITPYAPLIQAVFPRRDPQTGERLPGDLPCRLIGVEGGEQSPYPAGVLALLELPGGRFGRDSILSLGENPCFREALGEDKETVAAWQDWVEELHVRWGVDEAHRKETGAVQGRAGSWEFAFSRLLAGYVWDSEDEQDPLPFPLEGENLGEEAGMLMRVVRGLYADFAPLQGLRLPMRDWIYLVETLVETWLSPREDNPGDLSHRRQFRGVCRNLLALCSDLADLEDFSSPDIGFGAFRSYVVENYSLAGGAGGYGGGGVLCSSLKPLRVFPFRHLYVLGMEEGAWPRREHLPGYDLRERVLGRRIDLSGENVDRCAFLEIFFAARERLSFFYVGRDSSTGEPRTPAAPLQELFAFLDEQVYAGAGESAAALTFRHPLAPYDPLALQGQGPYAASDPGVLALAQARRGGSLSRVSPGGKLEPWKGEEAEITMEIPWTDLLSFLKNPLAVFYRRRMRVPPPREERDREEGDALEADYLDWWAWRDQIVGKEPGTLLKGEQIVGDFQKHLELTGAVNPGILQELQREDYCQDIQTMGDQFRRLQEEGLSSGPFSLLRLSPDAPAPGEDFPAGEIWEFPAPRFALSDKQTAAVVGDLPGLGILEKSTDIWYTLEFLSAGKPAAKHHLRSWVMALCLGAVLPPSRLREFRLFRLGKRDFAARHYGCSTLEIQGEGVAVPSPRETLQALVELYREGLAQPIPLYPEWGEALRGQGDQEDFPRLAEESWHKQMNSKAPRILPRDCPFRERYFPGLPDFSNTWLRKGIQRMYP